MVVMQVMRGGYFIGFIHQGGDRFTAKVCDGITFGGHAIGNDFLVTAQVQGGDVLAFAAANDLLSNQLAFGAKEQLGDAAVGAGDLFGLTEEPDASSSLNWVFP